MLFHVGKALSIMLYCQSEFVIAIFLLLIQNHLTFYNAPTVQKLMEGSYDKALNDLRTYLKNQNKG